MSTEVDVRATLEADPLEVAAPETVSPRVAAVVLTLVMLLIASGITLVWALVNPDPAAPSTVTPQPTPTLDDLATSMARALAEGNPEVLRHQAFLYEKQTGCRVRWVNASIDRWNGTSVRREAAAREALITRLASQRDINGVSHGRADSSTSPGHVVHLIVAQSCR